jgi:hypothetical protein
VNVDYCRKPVRSFLTADGKRPSKRRKVWTTANTPGTDLYFPYAGETPMTVARTVDPRNHFSTSRFDGEFDWDTSVGKLTLVAGRRNYNLGGIEPTWHPTPALSLIADVRYTHDSKSEDFLFGPNAMLQAVVPSFVPAALTTLLGVISLGGIIPGNLSPLYYRQLLVHGMGFSFNHKILAVVSIGSNSVTFIDTATNEIRHTTYVLWQGSSDEETRGRDRR